MGDARADVIFGRKPLSSLASAYSTWRSSGGDTIAGELAESKAALG